MSKIPIKNNVFTMAPYHIALGAPYKSFKEQLKYEEEEYIDDGGDALTDLLIEEYSNQTSVDYAYSPATQDTAIGGNEAINSLWQFGVDDDLTWPYAQIPMEPGFIDTKGHRGLGRVYQDTYQANQHIMWMRFGVPIFKSMKDFYVNAGDSKLADIMSGNKNVKQKLGAIVGTGIVIAIALPWWPAIGAFKFVDKLSKVFGPIRINKFYEFRPKMYEYYHLVNTILTHIAIGMGFSPSTMEKDGKITSDLSDAELKGLGDNTSPLFSRGVDIAEIIATRFRRGDTNMEHGSAGLHKDSPLYKAMREASSKYDHNVFKKNLDVLGYSALQYVGFRIERGSDFSEALSNQTGEAPIAKKLNAKASEGREKRLETGGPVSEFTRGIQDFFGGMVGGAANAVGAGALKIVSSGTGYFDVPEVWTGSSFARSQSFEIQLRAKYGDPETIFQDIYIPLAMLMAGAFPIGVGKSMYTSPFLIEAYSKGLFSIPTGIIESMTIKRGLPEHGWTHDHLPTAVDVTITIKDLSPQMYLSLADGKLLDMFAGNDQMKVYLATLSGMSLNDMTNNITQFANRTKARFHLASKRAIYSSRYTSLKMSDTILGRAGGVMFGRNVGGS